MKSKLSSNENGMFSLHEEVELPIDGLPVVVQQYINEIVRVYHCPIEFPTVAVIAVFATTIGKRVKVTDGKLTIGAKCDATDYWCIFDNFSLTYFADADIDAVRAAYPKNTGATTGINEVNTGVNTGAIYNLNGVRVNNMTKKGVYIVNGKKFVVK